MKSSDDSENFMIYKFATALIGLLVILIIFVQRKYSFWRSRGIPGPKPKFLIGNTFDGLGKSFAELFYSDFQKYGPVYGIYGGLSPILMCGDPEMVKSICLKDFHKIPQGFLSAYLQPIERTFLTHLYGPRWKRNRSLVSPTFSSGKIKRMFKLIQTCIGDAMKELDEISENGGTFDSKLYWGRYNMDLIARCCFALNLFGKDDTDPIQQNFVGIFKRNALKIAASMSLPGWAVRFFKLSVFPVKNLEFLRNLILQLIEYRKKAHNEGFNDFLQLLIDAEEEINSNDTQDLQNKLTPEEIVGTRVWGENSECKMSKADNSEFDKRELDLSESDLTIGRGRS